MSASTKMAEKEKEGSWIKFVVIGLFILLIFLNFPVPCQSHGHHDHDHDHHHHHHEPPSFKYSREANEAAKKQVHSHDHDHDHHHGHDHHHHHHHEDEEKMHWRPESNFIEHDGDVFIQAMGSTLLISAAPFFILFLVPLDNSKEREPLLKVLLAFATGGLLGDAFLHLIPHALSHENSHNHGHEHNHEHHGHSHGGHDHSHGMAVGLCILGGIITFMLVDVIIRQIKGGHSHSHHHHHHETSENKKQDKDKSESESKEKDEKKKKQPSENKKQSNDKEEDEQKENKELCEKGEEVNDIKIAGYLNLAADFLHNFTDGLAIGASYLAGNNVGVLTTFTILLHEVPHEVGDFAILIQSGCSKPKAIMLQLVTAVGALIGTYISLLVGGVGDLAARYVLPYTAGGFIYIATVSVIPELLTDVTLKQSIKQIIAMLVGVGMMVLVAEYE